MISQNIVEHIRKTIIASGNKKSTIIVSNAKNKIPARMQVIMLKNLNLRYLP
jgi:hypothetical protein